MAEHPYFNIGDRVQSKVHYLPETIVGEIIGIAYEDVVNVWYIVQLDTPRRMPAGPISTPCGDKPWKAIVFPGTTLESLKC